MTGRGTMMTPSMGFQIIIAVSILELAGFSVVAGKRHRSAVSWSAVAILSAALIYIIGRILVDHFDLASGGDLDEVVLLAAGITMGPGISLIVLLALPARTAPPKHPQPIPEIMLVASWKPMSRRNIAIFAGLALGGLGAGAMGYGILAPSSVEFSNVVNFDMLGHKVIYAIVGGFTFLSGVVIVSTAVIFRI